MSAVTERRTTAGRGDGWRQIIAAIGVALITSGCSAAGRPPGPSIARSPGASQIASSAAPSASGTYENPTPGRAVALQIPGMDHAEVTAGLEYARRAGSPLLLDLYRPANAGATLPVVLIGGPPAYAAGRTSGQKIGWAQLVAASGIAAAAFDIRSDSYQATPQDPSDDVAAAISFLAAHATELRIDPDRMCTLGFSIGTAPWHLWAAMHGPDPRIQCNVVLYGPLDFESKGFSIDPRVAPEYSAMTYLRRDGARIAPMLIAFGRKDQYAGIPESIDRFAAVATGLAAPVTVLEHNDAGHGFDITTRDDRTREILRQVLAFFQARLL